MRNSTLAAAATAAGLAVAAPAGNGAVMRIATSGQLGLAEGAGGAEKAVLVCDPWTCSWRPDYWYRPYSYDRYWGLRRHYWWGWHGPAKPLIQKRSWLSGWAQSSRSRQSSPEYPRIKQGVLLCPPIKRPPLCYGVWCAFAVTRRLS